MDKKELMRLTKDKLTDLLVEQGAELAALRSKLSEQSVTSVATTSGDELNLTPRMRALKLGRELHMKGHKVVVRGDEVIDYGRRV